MNYRSTRDNSWVGSVHAIARGISPDGGFYLPELCLPDVKGSEAMLDMDYRSRASGF